MQMGALSHTIPTPMACVRAVQDGVDLLLVCHTRQVQIDSTLALAEAVDKMKAGVQFPSHCPDTEAETGSVLTKKDIK